MRDRLLLFLGAGASAPLGVPTNENFMDDFLHAHPTYSDFWTDVRGRALENGYSRQVDLEAAMTSIRFLGAEDRTDYLQEAAGIAPFLQNPQRSTTGMEIVEGDFDSSTARAMTEELERFVREKCEHLDPRKLRDVYDPLLDSLSDWHPPKSVHSIANRIRIPSSLDCFTTNYDMAFETYFAKHIKQTYRDGFQEEGGNLVFKPEQLRDLGDGHRILHLHGSVEMIRLQDGRILKEKTWSIGRTQTTTYDAIEGPALIYPMLEKELARYPFPQLMAAFQESVRATQLLAFVGFSFRDLPILRALQDGTSSEQKLVIISSSARQVAKQIQPRVRARVIPVVGHLGESDIATKIRAEQNA